MTWWPTIPRYRHPARPSAGSPAMPTSGGCRRVPTDLKFTMRSTARRSGSRSTLGCSSCETLPTKRLCKRVTCLRFCRPQAQRGLPLMQARTVAGRDRRLPETQPAGSRTMSPRDRAAGKHAGVRASPDALEKPTSCTVKTKIFNRFLVRPGRRGRRQAGGIATGSCDRASRGRSRDVHRHRRR